MSQAGRPERNDHDLVGRTLGDFRIVRRLGRGGMAEVWLAEQASLQRSVALKLLKPELASDETYVQRFRTEARAAARLVHGNIIQIYDVGQADGFHFIAQEYVQGQNLREYLVRCGALDRKEALSVMRQVAAALQKAADEGIVHRDIKPENIMLGRGGEVKVADFGLARIVGEGTLNLTQVGMTMGTPLYMSPEQVQGKPLDARSDIYSFGVTCHHMLAGEPPFRGETALAVAVQHLQNRPPDLETYRPDLPPGLGRMLRKMLAKNPAERYQQAREILADLRTLGAGGDDELGTDWAMPSESHGLPEFDSPTRRLASLMRTETQLQPTVRPRGRIWPAVAATVLGLCCGPAAAWLLRERPVLAAERPGAGTPKQDSAQAQYFLAAHLNTEEGWNSVLRHYPHDEYYCRRATQQLARLFLYDREYERALPLFDQLANLPDSEAEFRAIGLAGKCVVLSFQDRYTESVELLLKVWPLQKYLDPSMRDLLQDVLLTNRKRADEQQKAKLRELRTENGESG